MDAIEPAGEEGSPPARRRYHPGPGRGKGTPNKMTREAREALMLAFEKSGGVNGLVKWIKADVENRREFYRFIFPRLLPLKVNAEVNKRVIAMVRFKGIDAD